MRIKERAKDIELKCTCATCGGGVSECACDQGAPVNCDQDASANCDHGAASTQAGSDAQSLALTPEAPMPLTAPLDRPQSNSEAAAQRPRFPAPTGVELFKWLLSATVLCLLILSTGAWLLNWRPLSGYKLMLQNSYAAMHEPYHSNQAINFAEQALRQAKRQHAPDNDMAAIYHQLDLAYSQRFRITTHQLSPLPAALHIIRAGSSPTSLTSPSYGGNYRVHYRHQ